jgi:CO/xanthine dehydrogenase Mo-binding subunit
MEIEAVADSGGYACQTPFVTWRSVVQATGPYEVENVKTDTYGYYTNNPYTGAMRGYGSPQVIFAQESLMDELARELGLEPVELRKRNMYSQGSVTASGQKLDRHTVSLNEVMDKAMEAIDYKKKYEEYSKEQSGDKKKGIGLSISFRGCSLGAEAIDAAASVIQINKDGSVAVYSGLAENGQGLKTIFSQMAAEVLGIPMSEVEFKELDTSFTPDSGSTVASRATLIGGNAVKDACRSDGIKGRIFV